MAGYYLYLLDAGEHIVARKDVHCDSDEEAAAAALDYLLTQPNSFRAVDVWQRDRHVRRVGRPGTP